MSVIIPDCTSCKNFIDKKTANGSFCCLAFPEGIPNEYFWCKIDVRTLSECANGKHFEDEQERQPE